MNAEGQACYCSPRLCFAVVHGKQFKRTQVGNYRWGIQPMLMCGCTCHR